MSWKMSTSVGGSSPLVSRACRCGVGGATVWLFTTLSRYLTKHTHWCYLAGPCGFLVGSGQVVFVQILVLVLGSSLGLGVSVWVLVLVLLCDLVLLWDQGPGLCLGSSLVPALGKALIWVMVLVHSLPAQDGHGLALIIAGQQGLHVVVEHRQRHLDKPRTATASISGGDEAELRVYLAQVQV